MAAWGDLPFETSPSVPLLKEREGPAIGNIVASSFPLSWGGRAGGGRRGGQGVRFRRACPQEGNTIMTSHPAPGPAGGAPARTRTRALPRA